MSSQVGLAGSVATNLMGTNVTPASPAAPTSSPTNNIAVLATNTDNAAVFAGAFAISKGAAGGAGSLVTNKITGNTSAYISGATTKVDARGTSSTRHRCRSTAARSRTRSISARSARRPTTRPT